MKIENMTDFITGQLQALQDLETLKEYYMGNIPFEQEKMEIYLFTSLLLCNVQAIRKQGKIFLLTESDYTPVIEEEKLTAVPFLKNVLKTIKEETVEQPKITQPPEKVAELPKETQDTPQKSEEPENTQKTTPKTGVLHIKDIPRETADDNTKYKSLNSMWMQQHSIIYCREDSYCEETFVITVYPLAMTIERMSLPMLCVIQHENAKKYAFTDELKSSLEIIVDDFKFGISLCFREGELKTVITQSNTNYKKIEETETVNIQGKVIPSCFGKKIENDTGWIELYPISIENEQQTGLTPFVYRAMTGKQIETGLSDYKNEILVAFTGGAHNYGMYWTCNDDGERQLNVEEI